MAIPVTVDVLSRLPDRRRRQRRHRGGLETGRVDCVIGTHRLLTEGMEFKDLGLLIIDEEQRFGVQQKESSRS